MRKISVAIAKAFCNSTSKKLNNTETDGQNIWLYGNLIAKKGKGQVWISNAGWCTQTTHDRLRAILSQYDIPLSSMDVKDLPYNEFVSISHLI